jgi:hypothetical protein
VAFSINFLQFPEAQNNCSKWNEVHRFEQSTWWDIRALEKVILELAGSAELQIM